MLAQNFVGEIKSLESDGIQDGDRLSGLDRLNFLFSNRALALLLGFSLTLSIIGIGIFALRSHLASQSVVNSSKVREVAESFLGALRTAEAAQRGYLIAGDEDYLGSFERAVFEVQVKLSELTGLTWSTEEKGEQLEQVRMLTNRKIDSLKKKIKLKRQGDEAGMLELFKLEFANETTRKIATLTSDLMIAESLKITSARNRGEQANERFGIGILILMLCVALLIFVLFRRSRFEIETLNERQVVLDDLVSRRTAALEAEKLRVESLLSDVSHRIGNSLSMVASALSLQGRASEDENVQEALSQAVDRILSVASAQRRLRLTDGQDRVDAVAYFDQIVGDLRTTMPDDNVRIITSIEPMDLPGDMALSFGVLFNELVINALRHAFDGLGNGTISARLFRTGDEILFQVEDDGRGVAAQGTDGQGIGSLVIDGLVQSLDAEMYESDASQDDERKGTVFVIKKPFSEPKSPDERGEA